jgi:NADPH:quinone reductase-like Zn-dependent oxidoreductase
MASDDGTNAVRLEVRRDDLHDTRVVEEPTPRPAEGEILVRVEAFGLTANNISYAVFGDMLGYWHFFPSADSWGQIPTWGFAEVVESAHGEVPVGTRLFGYLPMASHVVLRPALVDDAHLVDGSEHRAALPPAYNSYRLVAADPLHDSEHEDAQMLLWPLFFTGFVLDRFLGANSLFGARAVVLSSASSKTAISTAHCLAARAGTTVIGLTSTGNVDLVRSLGHYDQVVAYDEIDTLAVEDAVYVDFAGNTAVRAAVHRRYGEHLAHSAVVGGTHWDQGSPAEVPGPEPVFFFAPDHWGPEAEGQLPEAWRGFVAGVDAWLRVEHRRGVEAVRSSYLETLDGRIDPGVGLVLSI